jgi:hypothetical protein
MPTIYQLNFTNNNVGKLLTLLRLELDNMY